MYNENSIDTACEREALAIETLSDWTDAPNDEQLHIRMGRMVELAKALGIKLAPHPRYPRQKVTKHWEKVCAALAANQPINRSKFALPLTTEDRQRRLAKRIKRREALKHLARMSARQTITLLEAAKLSSTSVRRLQRLAQVGTLPARKEVKHYAKSVPGRGVWTTSVGALRQLLASRIAA